MKKPAALIFFLLSGFLSFSQSDSGFRIHQGILAGVGTVGVGRMPATGILNAYITGSLEYYTEKNISIRGDGYYFVNSLSGGSPLTQNSSIYFGAFYHFNTHSAFDPFIGVQPGASVTRMLAVDFYGNNAAYSDNAEVCPLASVVAGFNFYGDRWFHIRFDVRYTAGWYLAPGSASGLVLPDDYNISELSFNFGLGWNLDVYSRQKRNKNITP